MYIFCNDSACLFLCLYVMEISVTVIAKYEYNTKQ